MLRLLHLLALLALIAAPTSMHRADSAPAAAHHAAGRDSHCGGSDEAPDDRDQGRGADCAIACSAMPSAAVSIAAAAASRSIYDAAPSAFFAGNLPGADPPPPRAA